MRQHTKQTLDDYIINNYEAGSFITSVLCNDLCESIGRADDESLHELKEIVQYIYSNFPKMAWGSWAQVNEWLNTSIDDKKDVIKYYQKRVTNKS